MTNVGYMNHLKENFTLIIFSLFRLNWPRKEFCNSIYKNEFFFFQNTISISFAQDVYGLLFTNMNIF